MGKILLNVMYAGDYLKEENNIGHEVINMYQADNGKHYVYANPYGLIGTSHNKEGNRVDTVVFVRRINASKLEILAKANVKKQVLKSTDYKFEPIIFKEKNEIKETFKKHKNNQNLSTDQLEEKWKERSEELNKKIQQQENIHAEQVQYIKNENITYGGVLLNDILANNKNNSLATYVTFEVDNFVRAGKPIFLLCEEEDCDERSFVLDDIKFAKQSFKMYFTYGEKQQGKEKYWKAGNIIKKILDDDKLWKDKLPVTKVDCNYEIQTSNTNFLKIIRKENDELVFSNLFAYFFNKYNNAILKNFASRVLHLDLKGKISIAREEKNIDLLIRDDKHIIVIENKIKSGINGIKQEENGDIISQLDKYYTYAEEKAKEKPGTEVKAFVFLPNYNKAVFPNNKKANNYKKILYSDIHKFFQEINEEERYAEDKYLNDFVSALEKHTRGYTDDLYEEMRLRFIKNIDNVK